jgi:predicted Rossmann-fold nucleotide-binding protein
LKERQRNANWRWTILRPQIIFGESFGSAMNLIPAIGTFAALLKEDGLPLIYPGGAPNLMEAVDADLLAHAIA